ncbi:MAG: hypothetical protein GY811_27625 [Myxococcales bacterium]|nr:hypothetical protein [Myxococcales bacterium]
MAILACEGEWAVSIAGGERYSDEAVCACQALLWILPTKYREQDAYANQQPLRSHWVRQAGRIEAGRAACGCI